MKPFLPVILGVIALFSPANADSPKVLTDIAPIHSLVAQVMGGIGEPTLLLAPSDDIHHFQLRPSQARALAHAEVVFWIGPELEPWLQESLDTLNGAAVSVVLLGEGEHPWLDPKMAHDWLNVIVDALATQDPKNQAIYTQNAKTAQTELADLIIEINALLAPVSEANYVVDHDAFDAFTSRFGLKILAALRNSEAANPGAARVARVRDLLTSGNVACVFSDVGHSADLVRAVTGDSGVPIGELDAIGVHLSPGPEQYGNLIKALANGFANCR